MGRARDGRAVAVGAAWHGLSGQRGKGRNGRAAASAPVKVALPMEMERLPKTCEASELREQAAQLHEEGVAQFRSKPRSSISLFSRTSEVDWR